MIGYSYTRPPGGRRYSTTDRAAARALAAAAAPSTLSAAGIAAMTDPDGIEVVVDVLFELESNRLQRPTTATLRASGAAATPASGDPASLVDGRRNATTATPAVRFAGGVGVAQTPEVQLEWTDGRRVNTVELHGDPTAAEITDVAVYSRATVGGAYTLVGTGTGSGRIAVAFDEVESYGIRARITGATGTPIGVVEVDPMFVRDVSDDVETLEVEWSREADPGSSTSPVGNYEASSLSVTLDNTDGAWNPATDASLDVGHRIEVAFGVRYLDGPDLVDELIPGGVFYTDPYDTDSTSTTVSINAVDKLGRSSEVSVSEPVAVNATVDAVVRSLALTYLDLDDTQVDVETTIGAVVLPYAYPSGTLGTYLADLAKATGATVHVDPLERLVVARRSETTQDVVATITESDALISFRRPPGYDVTTSIVTVNASPLELGGVVDLWAMPSGGITIPVGESYQLVATYSNAPGINGYTSGIVADGAYTITDAGFYADRAEITIRNDAATTLTVADLRVRGNELTEATYTARAAHEPSRARYGDRELTVDARLVQTQAQVDQLAAVLLDAFRSIDDDGVRRLPDLSFDGLGLLHVTPGDRVSLRDSTKGLSGDYTVLSRKLIYGDAAILLSDCRVRQASDDRFLRLDVDPIDDVFVIGY